MNVNKLIILLSMILLLTGCSESKKLSTNQSEDNNQIKYKSKDITINENLLKENIKKISSNVRNYGSDGEIESSEYINNQLTKYGYSVMFQEFDVYKQDQYTTVQSETNLDYLNNNFYNSDSIGKARNIIATNTATNILVPDTNILAQTAPLIASIEPTDKSIPPVNITNVIPAAIMAFTDVCLNTLNIFLVVKNDGLNIDTTTTNNASPIKLLYLSNISFLSIFLFCVCFITCDVMLHGLLSFYCTF